MKKLITLLITFLMIFSSCVMANNIYAEEDNTSTTEKQETVEPNEEDDDTDISDDDQTDTEVIKDTSQEEETDNNDNNNNKDDAEITDDFIEEIPEKDNQETYETQNTRSLEGMAYAVLTDDGDLIFFRSYNTYSPRKKQTVVDICGNTYIGKVLVCNEEDAYGMSIPDSYKKEIIRSFVALNQTIKPIRLPQFHGCEKLISFDADGFDASNVVNMSQLFSHCYSLETINFANFDTSNVSDMTGMFSNCSSLKSLDLNSLDISNVTSTWLMFENCSSLTSLDLSNINTSNVDSMTSMFSGCSSLKTLDLSNLDTSKVEYMGNMFDGCSSLETLNFANFDTYNVRDMSAMFRNCSSLKSLDLSSFDTSNVTSMGYMFRNCSSLTSLDLSNINTSNVESMDGMFSGCSSLKTLDLSNFDTSNVVDMYEMFYGLPITSLDLSNINTSNVERMDGMFSHCSSLKTLDLSNFDTSNVVNMDGMFSDCSSLTSLNLENFDTSNVKSMRSMFQNCSSLTYLNINNFDTSNVGRVNAYIRNHSMSEMFSGCSSLKTLDLSNFDTSGVGDMCDMFHGCSSLKTLDLSNFDTSNVVYMDGMFRGCSSLTSLNIENFDTSKVTRMHLMFTLCRSLKSVKMSKKFTKWIEDSYFDSDFGRKWHHGTLAKTSAELYREYPNNASDWAGWWLLRDDYHSNRFNYKSDLFSEGEYTFEYDDTWFFDDSHAYNNNISKLAIRLCLAAFDTEKDIENFDRDAGYENIQDFYKKIGLDPIAEYNYPRPEYNTIGTAIGSKDIGDGYTLIVMTLRGGNYKNEWLGNLELGSNDDEHLGFSIAADEAIDRLMGFIYTYYDDEYSNNKIKLLITGYSRAAAVSNLVGHKLNKEFYYGALNIHPSNTFVYCFETPAGGKVEQKNDFDNNIWSVINLNDIVTKVAPWDYCAYGQYKIIPNALTTWEYFDYSKPAMIANYQKIFDCNNKAFDEKYIGELDGQLEIVENLVNSIASVVSPNEYATKIQPEIVGEKGLWYNSSLEAGNSNVFTSVLPVIYNCISKSQEKSYFFNSVKKLVDNEDIFDIQLQLDLNVSWYATGDELIVLPKPKKDWFKLQLLGEKEQERIQTMLYSHYPELCLSWVDSFEELENSLNYNFDIAESNELIVNCPVDVTVYDNNDNIVAQIIKDEIIKIDGGLYSYIDNNGQKIIVMPSNKEYRTELYAYDEGKLTYTVKERDFVTNKVNKIVSYQNIELSNGDSFSGIIDDLTQADDAQYVLIHEGNYLEPDQTLYQDDIQELVVNVEIIGDGYVLGGGVFNNGEFAKVEVVDTPENFLGWYEDDQLISEELSYRFLVDKDRNITAKFKNYVYGDSLELNKDKIVIEEGMNFQLEGILSPEEASKNNLFWYSDDYSIAYVEDGLITGVFPGTTTINIVTKYGPELTATCEVTVLGQGELYGDILESDRPSNPEDIPDGLWYSFDASTDEVYTGKAITKSFRVYEHKKLLKEKTDYTVTYKNNTNAGTATITINGKGNYTSSDTIEFNILPVDINSEDIVVSDIEAVKENGKIQKLQPVIKWKGKTLSLNKDYTLEYNDHYDDRTAYKDSGLYTVTVKANGGFTGEKTLSYEIVSVSQTLISKLSLTKIKDIPYDGTKKTPDVLLKSGKDTLTNGVDYELSYSDNNTDIGTVTVTITGKGLYSGTRTTTFKITGTSLTKAKLKDFEPSMDYDNDDGPPFKQNTSFIILDKDKNEIELRGIDKETYETLSEDLRRTYDYTYEYQNNISPGKATVIYTGVNGYTGTVKKTFTINGIALSRTKIEGLTSSFIYDGTQKHQDIAVTYLEDKNSSPEILEIDKDYELSYTNNDKAGTATLIITGKGKYTGTVKKTYKISPYDISKDSDNKIYVQYDEAVPYSKAGARPSVKVYFGSRLLKDGTDYTVSYSNNTNINDGSNTKKLPTIIIKGKGNFTGTNKDNSFTISKRDIDSVSMYAQDKVYSLNKNGWKSSVTLTDNGKKLSSGKDYDKNISYTYENDTIIKDGSNKNKPDIIRYKDEAVMDTDIIPAGTQIRVTVTGMGSYYGQTSYIYRISKADINKTNVTIEAKKYTGKPVTLTKEDIIVKLGKEEIDPSNYEIDESSYTNNIKKGKATVVLKGINDLGSTKKVSFTIGPKSFLWWLRNLGQ